jgi:hypothetical protein
MALIACEECGKDVSTSAANCPHCGAPVSGSVETAAPAKSSNKVLLVLILVIVAAALAAVIWIVMVKPNQRESEVAGASELDKIVTTVENVQKIGQSVEMYIMDNPNVGCPKAANISDLIDLFIREGINLDFSVENDGWGNPFIYIPTATFGARGYTIRSFGSNNSLDPALPADGIIRSAYEDVVWINGRFVARPEGAQRRSY